MAPHDAGQRDRRRRGTALILAASARLYGASLALYPKAFRRRYAEEMRRDFCELSREGLEEGGGGELVRVWRATLSDLAVTALKERSTMLARNAYLPVNPRIAATAVAAVVLVALTVTVASLVKTPQYEASTTVLIGKQGSGQPAPLEMEVQELQQLTMILAEAADSRPVAEDAIERLGLSVTPGEFLERLDAEPIENTQFVELSYTDPDPKRARWVANTVGDALSRRVSEVGPSADAVTATLWESAQVPEAPASPNPLRDGLITLVSGLLLCVGSALALPRIAASGVERSAFWATGAARRPVGGARGVSATLSTAEAAKEKELLEALGRRWALTVAGAALETSLTVEEAERMLSTLAAKGHLEVRVEHGRLLYSLWEGDAPI